MAIQANDDKEGWKELTYQSTKLYVFKYTRL